MKKIIAIVPARSGSKGIPNKNILPYKGKPLIAHAIQQGLNSKYINKVVVSTDSLEYRDISLKYGAEVPYLRPLDISLDYSTDYEFFMHHINWIKNQNLNFPDLIVHLRPTYPSRRVSDIDAAISQFLKYYDEIDSLRSVIKAQISPFKMWKISDSLIKPILPINSIKEAYNMPRQLLDDIYWQNACIDIVKVSTLINMKSVSGEKIMPYIMSEDENLDIDYIEDYNKIRSNKRKD